MPSFLALLISGRLPTIAQIGYSRRPDNVVHQGSAANPMTQIIYLFSAIASLVLILGAFSLITGRDVLPNAIRSRLRRVPASARDERLQGLAGAFGGLIVLWISLGVLSNDWVIIVTAFLPMTASAVAALTVRHLDRQAGRISSGWDELKESLRPQEPNSPP
jgi:hypothetical protein